MNDMAIDIILDYMNNVIPQLDNKHDPLYETRFSQRWAAAELIESLFNHPTSGVIDIIEDFIVCMTLYIRDTESKKMKKHFKTAQETAEDIGLRFV